MNKLRIITAVCWFIVAVMLGGLAVWFMTGTVFGIRTDRLGGSGGIFGWGIESLTGTYVVDGVYSVDSADIRTLKIDWVAGDVTVRPHDGDEILITEYARRELRENEKLHISTSKETLTIKYLERRGNANMPQKRIEVLIPDELSGSLKRLSAETTSGRIDVADLGATELDAETVSGSITLTNITARKFKAESISGSITLNSIEANDIKIDSLSGAIRASNTTAEKIDAESTSGSINVSGAFDRVDAESTSGSVSVSSSTVPGKLKAETVSGSITISVPDEGGITVNHGSISGSFSSDIPVIMQNRGAQFELSTISGRTRILIY